MDDSGINARRHDAKGIPGRDKTVMGIKILELGTNDCDVWKARETTFKSSTHRIFGVDKPEVFEHVEPADSLAGRKAFR